MSDDTNPDEAEAEPNTEENPDDTEGGEGEEVPDLDADEKADVPTDLAKQMRESGGIEDEEDDTEGDDPTESKDGEGEDTDPEGPAKGGSEGASEGGTDLSTDWGEVYVDGLGILLIEVAGELNEQGQVEMDADDVHNLATSGPVDLEAQAAAAFGEMGMEELSPGQATLAGSAFVAFAVLVTETDVGGQLVEELFSQVDGMGAS